MIHFEQITLQHKDRYEQLLSQGPERGCEYSFANLFAWGRQKIAFIEGFAVIFAQYARKSVYLFPVGSGDLQKALHAIIDDAQQRGIPCRFTGLIKEDCLALEAAFPGKFRFHNDRDSYDYIYNIEDLASLKGKKFQKKRNHLNKFRLLHPKAVTRQITDENVAEAAAFVDNWYALQLQQDPTRDFQMEQAAFYKALQHKDGLQMEGLMLYIGDKVVAFTMGSFLSRQTFDIHFEKALERVDGAYAAINQAFARCLQEKYPELLYLNREDDLGLEGLRKAKLSYQPAFMGEKYWAHLLEDGYDY